MEVGQVRPETRQVEAEIMPHKSSKVINNKERKSLLVYLANYANNRQKTLFKLKLKYLILTKSNMEQQLNLHQKIKQLRLNKNLTQLYIAEELGIDAASYSRLERGETRITINRIIKIAEIFDVGLETLIIREWKESPTKLLKTILNEVKMINQRLENNDIIIKESIKTK